MILLKLIIKYTPSRNRRTKCPQGVKSFNKKIVQELISRRLLMKIIDTQTSVQRQVTEKLLTI